MSEFQEIAEMGTNDTILARLAGATLGENIDTDQVAQIRAFCANFERFTQSPRFILAIIQPEFHFRKGLNTYKYRDKAKKTVLENATWPDRLFVLVDHRDVDDWLPMLIKKAKTSFICALLPSRVETVAFHEYVLRYAKEVRFLRGKTLITKEDLEGTEEKPYSMSYMLVFFSECEEYQPTPERGKFAVIALQPSFTSAADDQLYLE